MNRLVLERKSMVPGKDPATTASQSAGRQSMDISFTTDASSYLSLGPLRLCGDECDSDLFLTSDSLTQTGDKGAMLMEALELS